MKSTLFIFIGFLSLVSFSSSFKTQQEIEEVESMRQDQQEDLPSTYEGGLNDDNIIRDEKINPDEEKSRSFPEQKRQKRK
jgi:hypothetical protein